MPPIKQQYYLISIIETNPKEAYFSFATEPLNDSSMTVDIDVQKAYLSTESKQDDEFLFVEKEKIEALTFSEVSGKRLVFNTRKNRRALGLKYKYGELQRAVGTGIEEEYILLLGKIEESDAFLSLATDELDPAFDLREATVYEPVNEVFIQYLSKTVAEALAVNFSDGSLKLTNSIDTLEALDLEYKDGILCKKEVPKQQEPKAPKEKSVSWIGLGIKAVDLFFDIKKAVDQSKPQPAKPEQSLQQLAKSFHQISLEQGFWQEEQQLGELLLSIANKMGDAMTAYKDSCPANWDLYNGAIKRYKKDIEGLSPIEAFERYIQGTFEDEIITAVICLLELCVEFKIDLYQHLKTKLDYYQAIRPATKKAS